jgi:hypothetical protein
MCEAVRRSSNYLSGDAFQAVKYPGGDHRLQTIDRPALFKRIRWTILAA